MNKEMCACGGRCHEFRGCARWATRKGLDSQGIQRCPAYFEKEIEKKYSPKDWRRAAVRR